MAKKKVKLTARTADTHILYTSSVQGVEGQLDFMERQFKRRRGRRLRRFREDFCGTAILSCDWARRGKDNESWGVDLHAPTLDWGRTHHLSRLSAAAASRVHLLCEDVMTVRTPPVDLIGAFNFSFNIFKERASLLNYFRKTYGDLAPDGVLLIDEFGGEEGHSVIKDKRKIRDGAMPDGRPLETFTYIWDQAYYNTLTHDIRCHIHFKFRDGTQIKNAFTYEWRLWTVPELRDLLHEAGYKNVEVYLEGWDDDADDTDGVFRRRIEYEGMEAWFGYLIAEK
jgi:hypothetical protein